MVYPREEKIEKLSQEEIISNTKLVIQGLEALKSEHNSILHSLLETIKCLKKDEEANLVHEKSNLLRKSVEMIELGLGEAQVRLFHKRISISLYSISYLYQKEWFIIFFFFKSVFGPSVLCGCFFIY